MLPSVDVASLNALENKNVITRFPSLSSRCTTVQVLKSPKTDSSIRTIFLPKVVFHSFRHSSITYKLKLNGGDIKAVQGDSGHAQASMVTEQYAHILDDDRRLNAQRFDDFFYQHQGAEPEMPHQTAQSIQHKAFTESSWRLILQEVTLIRFWVPTSTTIQSSSVIC